MAMKDPTGIHPAAAAAAAEAESPTAQSGRTYFINIPIRTVTGHVSEEHLDRLSMNLAVYGAGVVLVGLVAILFPVIFVLAMGKLIAWLLVLGGAMAVLQFLLMCGAPGTSTFLLLGALHLLVGLWILIHQIRGANMLILILSGWFLVHGFLKLLMAFQLRNLATWPAVMASGLLSIVLAFTVLVLAPRFGLVLLSIVFGSDLLVSGVSMLLIACIAFFGKRAVPAAAATAGVREPLMTGMSQAAASA